PSPSNAERVPHTGRQFLRDGAATTLDGGGEGDRGPSGNRRCRRRNGGCRQCDFPVAMRREYKDADKQACDATATCLSTICTPRGDVGTSLLGNSKEDVNRVTSISAGQENGYPLACTSTEAYRTATDLQNSQHRIQVRFR